MRTRRAFACLAPATLACVALACGTRTGLLIPDVPPDAPGDDVATDVVEEPDGFADVSEEPDVSQEPDVSEEPDAAEEDALPPIDVRPPPPDAPNPCDGGATLVYVITEQNSLMSFDPTTGFFTRIGTIACPSSSSPFSMAVDQRGIAYVVFADGHLFRVSTATASCRPTGFAVGQGGFPATFGMGFSRDPNGITETLYVAGDTGGGAFNQPAALASINVGNLRLSTIGNFRPSIYGPELTGTGAGDLFAFFSPIAGDLNVTAIGQIDKTTGAVVAETPLPGLTLSGGWAFGFWGGDFYIFTGSPSTVTRFRPSDQSQVRVAMATETIVGAGVSTCAPQQ
jgi:hypothetical protein